MIFIIKNPYDYLKEYLDRNNVTGPNRSIIDAYFRDMKLQGLKPKTVEFNSKVIIFLLENIENSLDKLSDDDSKMFQEALMESGYAESSQKQSVVPITQSSDYRFKTV